MGLAGKIGHRARALVAIAADEIDQAILVADADGRIVYSNRAFHAAFGYQPQAIRGRLALDLLAAEGVGAGVLERVRGELGACRAFQEEVPLLSASGHVVWMSALVKPVCDAAGAPAHYLLVFSDASESKQIQRLQRDVLQAVAQDRPLAEVMDLICRRVELIAPDVVCSILAVDEEALLHPLAAPSLPPHFAASVEGMPIGPQHGSCGTAAWRKAPVIVEDIETDPLWARFKQLPLPLGLRACWSSPITLHNGRVAGTFAFYYRQQRGPSAWHEHIVSACVSLCVIALERHEATARIARLAYYDSLTGLPNRARLREEMDRRFDRAAAPQAALLFLDIDHFKDVNDTLGHAVGDSFLREIARRIEAAVQPGDIVSRHGGDEFVVVLAEAGAERAEAVARHLLDAIGEAVRVEGVMLPASASIGISLSPQDGTDSATLLRNADTAMYRAKGEGRSTFRFFTPEMNRAVQDRLLLVALLREAVHGGQVRLAYQPQLDARSGEIAGVEALARWAHPALGEVPPARFIPLAEDGGLSEALGALCFGEACAQLRRWDEAGHYVPRLAVNVSALQFRNPALPRLVTEALERHGIAPARLTIEVTESVMIDTGPAAADNAAALRAMGLGIAMDEFGTGYSSLGHLARLPVTEIKIDRGFMADLEENEAVQALVTAMIRIGEMLKLRVVAEGVATVAQRRFLEALGCSALQGDLFAEPMDPAAFTAWLAAHDAATPVRGAA